MANMYTCTLLNVNTRRRWLVGAVVSIMFSTVHTLDNGLGRTPGMGYNTWYDLMGDITEKDCMETVAAFVSLEFPKFGYNYWNLDDLWSGGRNPDGTIYADATKFPSKSLKPLADYVHSKGLLFGAYTDRGTKQCGPGPGSQGHEFQDAKTFAEWEIDYLKEDACAASQDHAVAFEQYQKMRDGLNATGRPIYFSLCGWNPWYAPPDPALNYTGGMGTANSWRIGPDDNNWPGILTNININSQLANYSGPGGWNDPCLLLADDDKNHQRVNELQSRAQFSMWAIMASPLIISGNVRNMSNYTVQTYQNADVIAVDQDPMGRQGTRIFGGDLQTDGGGAKNGVVVIAEKCDSSSAEQVWKFGNNNSITPTGTFYHVKTKMNLDVDDCKTDLVLWSWVTTGCEGNKGFYFDLEQGNFKSQINGCAIDNGEGAAVTLGTCPTNSNVNTDVNGNVNEGDRDGDRDGDGVGDDVGHHLSSWTLGNDGSIRSSTGRCLSMATTSTSTTNVWARELSGGRVALVFINVGSNTVNITCDETCMKQTSVYGKTVTIKDLWSQTITTMPTVSTLTASQLVPGGGHAMWLLTPTTTSTEKK